MLQVAPAKWQTYLGRISSRYAGQLFVLRQQEVGEEQAQVVLWRIPLHSITIEAQPEGSHITVRAGNEGALIEVPLGLISSLSLLLSHDDKLEAIHVSSRNGGYAVLRFEESAGGWL